jgi:hypothetical protein
MQQTREKHLVLTFRIKVEDRIKICSRLSFILHFPEAGLEIRIPIKNDLLTNCCH